MVMPRICSIQLLLVGRGKGTSQCINHDRARCRRLAYIITMYLIFNLNTGTYTCTYFISRIDAISMIGSVYTTVLRSNVLC